MSQLGMPRLGATLGRGGRRAMLVSLGVLSLAAVALPGQLEWLDARTARIFDDPARVGEFQAITHLGSARLTVGLGVLMAVLVWCRCRPLAALFPAAVIAALVVNAVAKVAVARPRPPEPLTGTALGSFPSGHMIQAVVAFGLLPPALYALTGRRWAMIAGTAVAGAAMLGVGASRIALGAHWPTDVIAGALVGLFLLVATEVLLYRSPGRGLPACVGCPLHPG